ncbi:MULTISPECIES: methionine aminotransferase [Mixta]|uniref:methionine aminotransferase n=1 Tax=Mixta TaxID=2100764 RepID=UPI0005363A50|nr:MULTISPECIES: methionine aminotransferase [Mixta]AIX73730.1 aminotransferase [Pantoea sp. PSNIH2]MBS6057173.1 methionine aminotransferase [Pantoea sp.]POU45136.1 methionine aminotransferase [Pantoea sp. PSNIH5]POU63762.1 methionine aminotransferase [Pantoea sp. PSNIH4]POY67117.1 methionine aminotransferase [Pantoea sp. PSNIH3]
MTVASTVTHRSKLPDVGTTIFSVIGQLSAQHGAINLSQGAPNFPCDQGLVARVSQAMRDGHNQYAPMTGYLPLKAALAEKVLRLYGQSYDVASEILITASASEGIYAAITALVHPGDEVIFFEPAFDSYAPVVRLQGATPVALKLAPPQFAIDWNEVRAAITPRTRMIIINTPHNPTSQTLSAEDLTQLAALTRHSDIVILSDEVYEHMLFDGRRHHGMATHPELAQRSVIVSSFGKTFHVTGWRVGYCLAPAELMSEVIKVHQFLMYAADTPMQVALAAWLQEPTHYQSLPAFWQRKRDLLASLLQESPFQLLPAAGSFFMLASYGHFSDESDSEMVKRLIIEHGVATIPLSAFYTDGTDNRLIRLSFAKDDATLQAGAQALCLLKPR